MNKFLSHLKKFIWTVLPLLSWTVSSQIVSNIDSLENVVYHHPEDCNSLSKLSQAYLQFKPDTAQYLAKKVLNGCGKNDPDLSGRAYNVLGLCRFSENKLDSAAFYFHKAIDKTHAADLKFIEGVYTSNLAQVLLNKGDISEALNTYRTAEELIITHNYNDKADYFLATLYSGVGESYNHLGLYDRALKNLFKSYETSKKLEDFSNMGITMATIAKVYADMSDYDQCDSYNRKALALFNKTNYPLAKAMVYYSLAENAYQQKKYVQAKILLDSSDAISKLNKLTYNLGNIYNLQGLLALENGDYTTSEEHLLKALELNQKTGSALNVGQSLQCLGDLKYKSKHHTEAHQFYSQALNIYEHNNFLKEKTEIIDRLLKLNTVFSDQDSLEFYLTKSAQVNSDYLNVEKQKAITAQEVIYDTQQKEAMIKQQALRLEIERKRRLNLTYGIGFFIILGTGFWYWLYTKNKQQNLKRENELLDMKLTLNQMELNNLNQQLDPHEFKNLLQGIAPEIQVKAPETYKKLVKLLKLTNATLSNKNITERISNQLEQIESYLNLQKTIFPYRLDWSINNKVNPQIEIPRLLLKNLVENAYKHGIKPKMTNGKIDITLEKIEDNLSIDVIDNGIGFDYKSNTMGVGLSTYKKLFELLNRKNKRKAELKFLTKNTGAHIKIKIPMNYKY